MIFGLYWRSDPVSSFRLSFPFFFFFNDTATTEIYTLSLHDALPISLLRARDAPRGHHATPRATNAKRSEEHTSELQSRPHLVCRLLLEKKKKKHNSTLQEKKKKKKKKKKKSTKFT